MMLTVVCSAKGSPGATSTALALAATWTGRAPVLLEADPSGGDLAFRCRLPGGAEAAPTPSLVSLAAAVRGTSALHESAPAGLTEHAQTLASGIRLVPGLHGAAQTRAVDGLWPNLVRAATGSVDTVIADLGRIDLTTRASVFLDEATVIVLVCRPTLESLVHTRSLLVDLTARLLRRHPAPAVIPTVVAPARQAPAASAEIDQILQALLDHGALDVGPCAALAEDPAALAQLERGHNPLGRLAGTRLLRSAALLAQRLRDLDAPAGSGESLTPEAVS